jgi:hypothetical protein
MRNRFEIGVQSLPNHSANAAQSLRNRCAIAVETGQGRREKIEDKREEEGINEKKKEK